MPTGFGYDTYAAAGEFAKLTTVQKDQVILKAIVIDDAEQARFAGLQRLELGNLPDDYPIPTFLEDVGARKAAALALTEHGENEIRGNINLDKKALLFFSIPFDVGWSARVDGQPARLEKVDFGLTGILLDKGAHSIELSFRPRFLTLGLIVSALALLTFVALLGWTRVQRREPVAA